MAAYPGCDGGVCARLLQASVDLYNYRNDHHGDENHAAASHYLHMRFAGARVGPAFNGVFVPMIWLYDGLWKGVDEVVKKITGDRSIPTFSKHPASSFSPMIIAWAFTGLSDGDEDFFVHWGKRRIVGPSVAIATYSSQTVIFRLEEKLILDTKAFMQWGRC